MKALTSIIFASTLCFSVMAQAQDKHKEVSQDVRDVAVTKKLKAQKQVVAVYAQGLCCPSCAIGVRKKVKGLPFVDTKRLNKGVELDAKTQLVTIALKKGKKVDADSLKKAIVRAGYKPVYLYTMEDGQLKTLSLQAAKPAERKKK